MLSYLSDATAFVFWCLDQILVDYIFAVEVQVLHLNFIAVSAVLSKFIVFMADDMRSWGIQDLEGLLFFIFGRLVFALVGGVKHARI